MKTIKIGEHPLYIWLQKEKEWNSLNKLPIFLPTIEQYPLSETESGYLLNSLYSYLYTHIDGKADMKTILGKNMPDDSSIIKTFKYLQKIMPLDKNKKSLMWYDRYLGIMDQFKPMSDFFDKEYPEIVKGKGFRKNGADCLGLILANYGATVNCANKDAFAETVNVIDSRVERYSAKLNWEDLLKKKPSLFLAIYANKSGYELRQQELKSLFNSICNSRSGTLQGFDKNSSHTLGTMFAELLSESVYFKNTLAPTKRIDATLEKFLEEKTVSDPVSHYDYFINAAINSPIYNMKKLTLDFDKKNRVATMGKSNLTKDESEKYEEKKEEQLAVAPRVKKMKI